MRREVDIILDGKGNAIERKIPALTLPRLDLPDVMKKGFPVQLVNPDGIISPLIQSFQNRFHHLAGENSFDS